MTDSFYMWWFENHATEGNCDRFYHGRGVGRSRAQYAADPELRKDVLADARWFFMKQGLEGQKALLEDYSSHCAAESVRLLAEAADTSPEATKGRLQEVARAKARGATSHEVIRML